MYKLYLNDDFTCNSFYKEGIHNDIPHKCINITEELWEYLISLNKFKVLSVDSNKLYTISDINLFEKVPQENIIEENNITLYDRVEALEKENANLTFLLMESGVI